MTVRAITRDGGPGQTAASLLEWAILDVGRIHRYEHNPRRGPHPECDRIKASIRAVGLGQPLVVTQRPGDADYTVHGGGNTRLGILKELFAETGDRRFADVPCVIRPWTSESDILLAHLRENDFRAELTFLDKALAVVDVRRFLAEGAGESLTPSRLAEVLREYGYGLSQNLIAQMTYAVERLGSLLPQAFEGGIGRPQVARIRALDRAACAIWLERAVATQAEYDHAFAALCRRYDTLDWDLANLRRALEAEIAERAEASIHAVSLEIDNQMSGRHTNPWQRRVTSRGGDPGGEGLPRGWQGTRGKELPYRAEEFKNACLDDPTRGGFSAAAAGPCFLPGHRPTDDGEEGRAVVAPGITARPDLKAIRARLWTHASRLAQRNGLGDLMQPIPGRGLGFVLLDVPVPARVESRDPDAQAKMSLLWWHLAACAELTVAPLDALLPALPERSLMRRALVAGNAVPLAAAAGTLDPGAMGYRLWRQLDDGDWQDLLGLMDTYRALRRNAAIDDQALWGHR